MVLPHSSYDAFEAGLHTREKGDPQKVGAFLLDPSAYKGDFDQGLKGPAISQKLLS